MASATKPIRITGHATQQLARRGTSVAEVTAAIRTEPWRPAVRNRLDCRKDYLFGAVWNGKRYDTRQICPIFVEETDEIVVVNV